MDGLIFVSLLTGFRFCFSNPLHCLSVGLDQNEDEESERTTSLFTDENNSASEANSESFDYVSDTVDSSKFSFWSILRHIWRIRNLLFVICSNKSVICVFSLFTLASTKKTHRVTSLVSVDNAQQEAIAVLKKLKVCFEKFAFIQQLDFKHEPLK